jgi:hypothetical protein
MRAIGAVPSDQRNPFKTETNPSLSGESGDSFLPG